MEQTSHGPANTTAGAAGGHTSPSAGATKKLKAINYVKVESSHWLWWIIACVIATITLLRLVRLYSQRRRRIAGAAAKSQSSQASNEGSSFPSPDSSATPTNAKYWTGATTVLLNNWLHVRSFPLSIYSWLTLSEITAAVVFSAIQFPFTFYKTHQVGRHAIELPAGMMALVQIPLIVGLASRNNTISYLTGISYQNLNFLHRTSARMCIFWSWVHLIAYLVKGLGKHGPGDYVFYTGVVGLISLMIVMVSSFAIVRRVMYETFLVLHIVFVLLFMVMMYLHRPKLVAWVWSGWVIWGLDRFVSLGRMVIVNKAWLMPFKKSNKACSECTVELVDRDVIRLSVPRPLLNWGPGQHALVTMPTVALLRYEQHPFSFANVPTSDGKNEAVFVIRAHNGFTCRLVQQLQSEKTTSIPCYLDGPYGIAQSYEHHDVVLLVAGGTGITHVLSIFHSIIYSHRKGQCATTKLHLLWNIRHIEDLNWISPILDRLFSEDIPEGLDINIDVHLTKSAVADEPDANLGVSDYLATRASIDQEYPSSGGPSSANTSATSSGSNSLRGSANASNEKVDSIPSTPSFEKSERFEKRAGIPSLSSNVTSCLRFHSGRAGLSAIIANDVKHARSSMGISVCGPGALALDTRKAVIEVNSPRKVLDGQAKIDLSVERFGW